MLEDPFRLEQRPIWLQTYTGPDGNKSFVYDARGLLQSMTVTLGSTVEHWSFDYDALGRSAHVTYPDGHVRAQLYDNEGRVSSRCYQYASQSFCYTATYDGVGNPLTMTDPYGGSDSFTYDALNRLTGVTRSVGGAVEHVESYTYNAIGAVKTTFDPVAMSEVTLDDQRPLLAGGGNGDAAVPNTLGGQPVTLDGGGRVTSLNGVTFSYDYFNRVTGTKYTTGSNTVTETYAYDSFLRRVQRLHTEASPSSSTSTLYAYDGMNLVATLSQGGTVEDAYLFDGVDHPLRLMSGGSSYFYEVDLAGNVRRLRGSSGVDLGGYRYTAFGSGFAADSTTPSATIDQPLRWKGRWFEENIAGGVYEVRARWWSPQMGAFTSIDSYRYHRRSSTLWGWPGQNPLLYRDASGHDWTDTLPWVGGAIVAGPALVGVAAEAVPFVLAGALGGALGHDVSRGPAIPTVLSTENASSAGGDPIADSDDPDSLAQGDSPGGSCPNRGETASGAPDLPVLDSTGKVHGDLPRPQDLGQYSDDDLQQLLTDLEKSVQERIRMNDELGPDENGGHGQRQGDEQDLIQSIEKQLEGRGVSPVE